MDNVVDRHVFYISDGTAITAEVPGHAVMSQFPVTISSITLPFVENESRARAVKDQIDAIYQQTGVRPLVFYSIVLPEIRAIILQSEGFCRGYRSGAGGAASAGDETGSDADRSSYSWA